MFTIVFFFFFLLSRATTRNDLLARNNRLFDTAPSSVRLKEERCTGNLTSSLSLSLPHSFSTPSLPTDGSRARVIGMSHFVCRDVCFVCSLPIFRVPLPGEFPVCRGSSPFFLDIPLPFRACGTRLRTYTPFYRSFPSYSRDIPCVSEKESESRALFRGGFPFSHLWVPPYPCQELLPPTPVGAPWWSGVQSWATSTTILPAPRSL